MQEEIPELRRSCSLLNPQAFKRVISDTVAQNTVNCRKAAARAAQAGEAVSSAVRVLAAVVAERDGVAQRLMQVRSRAHGCLSRVGDS